MSKKTLFPDFDVSKHNITESRDFDKTPGTASLREVAMKKKIAKTKRCSQKLEKQL